MIPGFSGHLVSEHFLESLLAESRATTGHADTTRALGRHLRQWRASTASLGPSSSVRTLCEAAAVPLACALGFGAPLAVDADPGHGLMVATLAAGASRVVLVVTGWGERLDPLWRPAVLHALRQSAGWAWLFNGVELRAVDLGRVWARRFAAFDLDIAVDSDEAGFALARIAHAAAHEPGDDGVTAVSRLVEASDRHALGVSRSLRDGVLAASADIMDALLPRGGRADGAVFEQALTIVYRVLFLLFAEARGLVPLWHPVYRSSYSVDALRAAAERPGSVGLWATLRSMARLAHAGCDAGDLRVTPFNGRLFSPARTPLADRRGLDDEAARRAVLAISTRSTPRGRERIAYRDLGVEQLGSVYETLLDFEPRVERRRPGTRARVRLERGSDLRKSTGTFYTPRSVADFLVRRALAPLASGATPEGILGLRVVDPAMGSGAFLVAACHYLAGAYEAALVRTGTCHAADLDEAARVTVRRTIAERCLFGVDLNSMAVQLARLSLWLATLAADRPLTFLDHHLQAGDSLVGASVGDLHRLPAAARSRRDPLPLFPDTELVHLVRDLLPERSRLERTAGDTLELVRAKERALAALERPESPLSRWKRVADLWCASWFADDDRRALAVAHRALRDRILDGRGPLPDHTADRLLAAATAAGERRQFFHWELEFPEVFFAPDGTRRSDGGFDAVIGNPPWDMLRADSGEAGARAGPREDTKRLVRFTRDSGAYVAQSEGHANRYQLFVERALQIARPGGRVALVLPGGATLDHGSARLRRHLFERADVDTIVGFDNRHGLFPIHRGVRFVLLGATAGSSTRRVACRLGEHDPASLERIDDTADADDRASFPVSFTPAALARLTGSELAVPECHHPLDVVILERAAALFPPLGARDGWGARFGRELNASDDRHAFGATGWPVIEGKQLTPYRVNVSASPARVSEAAARARLGPAFRADRPRLAYRDVAASTNRTTLIAAMLPARCVSTHTLFCLRTPLPFARQHALCGLFNSFVVNFLVRLRVTTHVTTVIVESLPLPRPSDAPRALAAVAACARRLSRGDDARAAARLEALVARMFQLSDDEFAHVIGTFPLVDAGTRRAALVAFRDAR